ncbi:MAG: TonB-dependent receptor [Gammaproteobacteria bacterium]|nr:TonB-dependent receptor [Gammaproteobacteria bacterium]
MSKINFKKHLLATSVAIGMGSLTAIPVIAAEKAGKVASDVEVIQVTGIRASQKQALNVKRFANAVVDSISAEDIGKFPDKNIAESLQRVPGVAIARNFAGEGGAVSIRGTNPELTSVTLNGNYVASTGWFSQQPLSRAFNMDLMPTELVAGVDVYKSPTASLDEGGIGGTIVMRTRKPLDLDANTVFVSAEMQRNSIAKDNGLAMTGLASWKNDEETFGLLGLISTVETIGRAHKAENYLDDGWAGAGISEFNQDRQRDTIDLTAQFSPSENLLFTGHYLKIELDAGNTNQNYLYIPPAKDADGKDIRNDNVTGATKYSPTHGNALNGTATQGPSDDTNTRRAKVDSQVISFDVEYSSDNYSVTGTIGKTESTGGNGGTYNGFWTSPQPNQSIEFDFTHREAMLLVPHGVDPSDHSDQRLVDGRVTENIRSDEEFYAQVDFSFDVELGAFNSIETGLKVRDHDFKNFTNDWTINPDAYDFDKNGGVTKANFANGTFEHSGAGLLGETPTNIARINGVAFADYIDDKVTSKDLNKSSWGSVNEKTTAIYVQGNFDGEGFRGNVGLRYVETDTSAQFYDPIALNADENSDKRVKETNKYADFLPSFNLAIDVSEDLIFRASAARVMSRPNYTFLLPSFTFDPIRNEMSRGSVDLDPYRATQMDLGLEWYFNEEGLASATLFSKDIQSFIVANGQESIQKVSGVDITVRSPAQGLGGKVQGIELQYQQNFGDFGVMVNYTYSDGFGKRNILDADGKLLGSENVDLPGNSRNTYNITGFYENDFIATRLAYTYRDAYLGQSTGIGGNVVWDEHAFLDGSVTWHVSENIDLSFDATNLLGEVTVQRLDTSYDAMRLSQDNGRNFFIRASFRL